MPQGRVTQLTLGTHRNLEDQIWSRGGGWGGAAVSERVGAWARHLLVVGVKCNDGGGGGLGGGTCIQRLM